MDFYKFSPEEVAAVKIRFPKLEYLSPGRWKGILDFDRIYKEYRIIDSYEIGIIAPSTYPGQIPIVHEFKNRPAKAAIKHHKQSVSDTHYNPERGACLCVRQEERIKFPPGSDIVFFIENLVIPYFYGLSYFEEHGRWPWREYGHGGFGPLEFYAEDKNQQTRESIQELATSIQLDKNWKKYRKQIRDPRPKSPCICGSNDPFEGCHILAWQGVSKVHYDLKALKMNVYKVFSKT